MFKYIKKIQFKLALILAFTLPVMEGMVEANNNCDSEYLACKKACPSYPRPSPCPTCDACVNQCTQAENTCSEQPCQGTTFQCTSKCGNAFGACAAACPQPAHPACPACDTCRNTCKSEFQKCSHPHK